MATAWPVAPKVPPAAAPTTAPGAQPIGIVTRHPMTAPDDPPCTPPVVGFAGRPTVHAPRAAASAIVLMILIIVAPSFLLFRRPNVITADTREQPNQLYRANQLLAWLDSSNIGSNPSHKKLSNRGGYGAARRGRQ